MKRALVSVETVRAILNRNEDHVLDLIESGKLRFAFDLGCSGCHRRLLRVFALSIYDLLNEQDTQPTAVSGCLRYILPGSSPQITSTRLAELFNVGSTHIATLIESKDLVEVPNRKRRKTEARLVTRESAMQFLESRRCV